MGNLLFLMDLLKIKKMLASNNIMANKSNRKKYKGHERLPISTVGKIL